MSFDDDTRTLRLEGSGSLGRTGTAEFSWWIRNETSFQRFYFPDVFMLDGFVEVAGGTFANTPTRLSAPLLMLNTTPETVFSLYDCLSTYRETGP